MERLSKITPRVLRGVEEMEAINQRNRVLMADFKSKTAPRVHERPAAAV